MYVCMYVFVNFFLGSIHVMSLIFLDHFCEYVCMYVFMCMYMCPILNDCRVENVRMFVHGYVCMCMCMCARVFMRIFMHVREYTCT